MSVRAYSAIAPAIRWLADGKAIDVQLLPLLRAVAGSGSLNKAVASLGISYRHAWGLIGKMERTLGRALVVMDRGRGAKLSPFAIKLLEADDTAAGVIERELAATVQALERATPLSLDGPRETPLRVHASHDLALAELRDVVVESGSAAVDLHFRGSLECLGSLARGECDVAGFHAPLEPVDHAALAPYRPFLRARGLRLVRFVDRRQGLIVARGNPKRLLAVKDLAAKGVRFVNRQPESGTRLVFDRLLAAAGLEPSQIKGYGIEEFTHAAVAAMVASGMADAGFGIEAAASRQGLDFVALSDERYFLALRAATLAHPAMLALMREMKGSAFRSRLDSLPGYDAASAGGVVTAREGLRP